MSRRVRQLAFTYVCSAVEVGSLYKLLKPHLEFVLFECTLPTMCPTPLDIKRFSEDPQEFVRRAHDPLEDFYEPRAAATALVGDLVRCKGKVVLDPLLQRIASVLEAYQQALKDGGQAASRGSGRAAGSAAAQAEARQILNVGGKASEEEVREVAEKMIAMNDPAKGNTKTAADASERLRGTSHPTFLGGSEYLQQKITFARDILAR